MVLNQYWMDGMKIFNNAGYLFGLLMTFLRLRGGQEAKICVKIEAKHFAFPDKYINLLL